MDFHAAMETFAEAWVAANTQTAVNSDPQAVKSTSSEELPTLLPKDQLTSKSTEYQQQPPGQTQHSPPVGAGVKSLPIHCVIEQTTGPLTFEADSSGSSNIELDSYAILPSSTLFSELVRTSLVKLGYSATETINAKGAIQIKNWKPLSFDIITSDKNASLDDILGELTQVATLRIRLCSIPENTAPQNWTDNTVRCAVFSLLKEMSQSSLAKQCPLTQSAISNIANWKYDSKLSKEKCKEFGEWYAQFITQKEFKDGIEAVPKDSRLTFHPQHEIPTMRQWYTGCKAPTDDKLRFYAAELNKGHVRQERPKVTVAKLKIWWKNERQREKRNKDKKDSDKNSVRTCFDQPTANLNDEPSTSASLNSETQSFSHESLTSYLNL